MALSCPSGAVAETVTVGSTPTGHLMWIAKERGYFKDAGIDVKVLEFTSGVMALKGLVSGDVELATASEFAFVNSAFRHRDFRILAAISRSNSTTLFARKDSGIRSVKDLIGRRVGITKRAVTEFYLGEYLAINGFAMNEVEVVNLRAPEIVTEIEKGTIDAGMAWEPYVYRARQVLGDNFYELPDQDRYYYHFLLCGRRDWITANRDRVQAILRGLIRAQAYAAEYPDEAQSIIARRFKLDKAVVGDVWSKYVLEISLQQALLGLMEQESRWLVENGLAGAEQVPDFLDVIDAEPLQAVKPDAVQLIR